MAKTSISILKSTSSNKDLNAYILKTKSKLRFHESTKCNVFEA